MSEKKIRHLEMIQSIVSRLSGNLFLLKGWTVSLIVALMAFIAKDPQVMNILFLFAVIVIFWLLDGYFLSIERCYRELYDDVRLKADKDVDFSMDFKLFSRGRNTWFRSIFSKTLSTFYGVFIVVMIVMLMLSHVKNRYLNIQIHLCSASCDTISAGN